MIEGLKPYPEMKDSGVALFGEVPKHWEVRRTKTLLSRNDSGVWGSDFDNEGVIVLRSTEQKIDGGWKISAPARRKLTEDEYRSSRLEEGDLVVTKSSGSSLHIGKTSLVSREIAKLDCCFSNFMQRLRTRKNTVPGFLRYALNCDLGRRQLESLSDTTTGLANLNREIIGSVYVANPTISEQIEIIRFLDSFDRHIKRYSRAKEEILQLLEEQKQATIQQAITGQIDVRSGKPYATYKPSGVKWLGDVPKHWEVRRLRNVVDMRVSNVDKHVKDDESPVRLCNYVDVYYNDYINKQMDFMHVTATEEEVELFRLERDDVLITKDSETWDDIGVPALVTEPARDLVSGYHLALLRPRPDRLAGAYLLRALQSKGLAYQFHVEAKGVTRYGLSYAGIKSVWLPFPSLSEQTAIVQYLDEVSTNIETAITRMRRQIELFQEYRTRLISDVVTGKLDVREAAANLPNDTHSMDDLADRGPINDTVS